MVKKDNVLLYLMMAGLSIMLILRDISGMAISKFIFLGYIIVFMIPVSYKTMVAMLCFILPLVCGLPGTYLMPVALVLLFLKRKTFVVTQVLPIFFFLALELFSAIWYPPLQIQLIIQYISFAGVMFFLINDDLEEDYLEYVKYYLFGVVLLFAVIIIVTLKTAPTNWLRELSQGLFRIGDVREKNLEMQLTMNANSLAYYSLTGISCSFLLIENKTGIRKVLYIAVAVFAIIIGLLTLSRSWLIVAVGCLLVYVLSKLRNPKQFLTVVLVMAIIIAGMLIWSGGGEELIRGFEARLSDNTLENGGNRVAIFNKYMQIYFSDFRYMILGAGVTQTKVVVGLEGSVHNGLQQILVCCGFVGFVVYMIFLLLPIMKSQKRKRAPLVYWLPFVSIVVFTQTIQFLNPTMLMLPYIIGIFALKAGGQDNEKLSDNGRYRGRQSVGLAP